MMSGWSSATRMVGIQYLAALVRCLNIRQLPTGQIRVAAATPSPQWPSHGALQYRESLVIVVDRVDVVGFGLCIRCSRRREVDECRKANRVFVLHEVELLACLGGVCLLESDGLLRGLERQIRCH